MGAATGGNPTMGAIFISHSSRDNERAAELAAWLGRHGHHSLFLDFDPALGIPAGRHWERELYLQLRACQAVIVLCSEHAMASDWCFVEITHARALGKPLFPLLVAPCTLRATLADVQVVDATAERDAAYERLLRGLREAGLENAFAWDPRRPPYPGLMAFQEADAAVFFGRDADIRAGLDALNRVRRFGGARLTIYLGASGSGKSSLLRAGVLPRLGQDPQSWIVIPPLRPLRRPLDELAASLRQWLKSLPANAERAAFARRVDVFAASSDPASSIGELLRGLRDTSGQRDATVVVPVDQFEEALTGTEASSRFLRVVAAIADDPERQAVVLATLRSDFFAAVQTNAAIQPIRFDTLAIGHLGVEGLVQVIEGPAQVAGMELETGLAQLLLADAATDDALPLLAFALRELWEIDGAQRRLRIESYRETLGGLHGAVARAAEAVITAEPLRAEQEDALRAAFLSMVRLDESGQYVRQAVPWSDLPQAIAPLLERFVAARLLISGTEGGQRMLEVAHEALFRVWTRARQWLDADRDNLRLREGLRQAAREWHARARPAELLVHRGSRLEALEALAQQTRFPLDAVARDYLRACVDAREAARAAERRELAARRRRVQLAIASLLIGLVIVSTLGLVALRERQQATERLASLHWVNGVTERDRNRDDLKALHHFLEAASLARQPDDARNALVAGDWLAGDVALAAIVEPAHGIETAAIDSDGARATIWTPAGEARAFDLRTGLAVGAALHDGTARKVVASPRGRHVVLHLGDDVVEVLGRDDGRSWLAASGIVTAPVFSDDETRVALVARDGVRVFDAGSEQPRATLPVHGAAPRVVLSHRGENLLTFDDRGMARVWNVDDGSLLAEWTVGRALVGGTFSSDASRVLVWARDGPAVVWPVGRGARIELGAPAGVNPSIMNGAFFAAGRRVLTWNYGGVGLAQVFDADTGKLLAALRHDDAVRNTTLDRSGTRVLSWSDDGTARLWDSATGRLRLAFQHEREVRGAAFGPDEKRIVTWSNDGTARVWDATSGEPASLPLTHDGPIHDAAFSPDGRSVLTSDRRSARLWRLLPESDRRRFTLTHRESVLAAGFAAGDEVIVLTVDGRLHRWAGEKEQGDPLALPRKLAGAAFDPDARRIAGWSSDDAVGIWSTDRATALVPPMRHERSDLGIRGLRWNGDGTRLLSFGEDRTARLWEAATGKPLAVFRHPVAVSGARFAEDPTRIVTWAIDRVVRVWDVARPQPLIALPAHEFDVRGAVPSGDVSEVLSFDANGTIRVCDARSGAVVQTFGRAGGDAVRGATFDRDERRILVWDETGVRIFERRTHDPAVPALTWDAGNVRGARWNADESIVLTVGDEGARLWSSRSGHALTPWLTIDVPLADARLRADERALLAFGESTARLWEMAPPMPGAQQALLRLQADSGTRLGARGDVELIPADTWRALREQAGPVTAAR